MAQNIYDNPDFFTGYSQLPRQVHGLDGAPEWPAIRAMLPTLAGKRVADLGCGFGWASRWMRAQGAVSVLGLDLSQNMIARAKADTSDPAIEYRIADLETLELPEAAFRTRRRVEEFAPAREQIEQTPDHAEELERPMMLLVSARKSGTR